MTFFADLTVLIKEDIAPIFDEVITAIIQVCTKQDEFKE